MTRPTKHILAALLLIQALLSSLSFARVVLQAARDEAWLSVSLILLAVVSGIFLFGNTRRKITGCSAALFLSIFAGSFSHLSCRSPIFQSPYLDGFLLAVAWVFLQKKKAVLENLIETFRPLLVLAALAAVVSLRSYFSTAASAWEYFAFGSLLQGDFTAWLGAANLRSEAFGFTFASTLWAVFWTGCLVCHTKLLMTENEKQAWRRTFLIAVIGLALFAIVDRILHPALGYRGFSRVKVGDLLPLAAGNLAALSAIALSHTSVPPSHGWMRRITWALSIIIVAWSVSLSALLALAAGLLFYIGEIAVPFREERREGERAKRLKAGALVFGLVAAVLLTLSLASGKNHFFRYYGHFAYYSDPATNLTSSRPSYYRWGIKEVVRNTILGLGPGWGEKYELDHQTGEEASIISHSYFLDLTLRAGVLAPALYLLFLLSLLALNRSSRTAGMVAAVIIISTFTSVPATPVAGALLALCLFLSCSFPAEAAPSR